MAQVDWRYAQATESLLAAAKFVGMQADPLPDDLNDGAHRVPAARG